MENFNIFKSIVWFISIVIIIFTLTKSFIIFSDYLSEIKKKAQVETSLLRLELVKGLSGFESAVWSHKYIANSETIFLLKIADAIEKKEENENSEEE